MRENVGLIGEIPVGIEPGAAIVFQRDGLPRFGSMHPAVALPDGRQAMADYRHPVVHVMRRVNDRIASMSRADATAASAGDYAILGRWLDRHPEQTCSHTHCALHGPPSPGHYTPPRYRDEP